MHSRQDKRITVGRLVESGRHLLSANAEYIGNAAIVIVVLLVLLENLHILPAALEKGIGIGELSSISVIQLILLIFLVERVVVLEERLSRSPIIAFAKREDAYDSLIELIAGRVVHKVDLIQFSGYAARRLLKSIAVTSPNAQVRLLLQHPDEADRFDRTSAPEDVHSLRHSDNIKGTLTDIGLVQETLKGKLFHVDFRYYRTPACVATVVIDDDLVALGWYRYSPDSDNGGAASANRGTESDRCVHLRGHTVPAVLARGSDGRDLREFADSQFDSLWTTAEIPSAAF